MSEYVTYSDMKKVDCAGQLYTFALQDNNVQGQFRSVKYIFTILSTLKRILIALNAPQSNFSVPFHSCFVSI